MAIATNDLAHSERSLHPLALHRGDGSAVVQTPQRLVADVMGWRSKLRGGAEHDALTRWRRFLNFNAGVRAWIKRKHNKRERKRIKDELHG